MKKYLILTAAALFLAACQPAPAETEEDNKTEPEIQETETAEQEAEPSSVIWVKEPSMKLSSITEMEAHPFILGASVELTGYPSGWAEENEKEAGYGVPHYRDDALIVSQDGRYGILDYDGNVLYPLSISGENITYSGTPVSYQPYTGFIIWDTADMALRFSSQLDRLSYVRTGGLGGYAPSPYVVDHEVWINDPQTMQPYRYENMFGTRIMAEVTDSEHNTAGCAVIDRDTSVLMETPHYCSAFINGMVTVSEKNSWEDPGRLGFVSAEGKDLTGGPVYEEAGWFEDGYAPVKVNGMWAYIDEEGRQVTDAVFTDASVLNRGRAFVQIDGLYGILDLAETLKQGIAVNAETCAGSYQEVPLDNPPVPEIETLGKVRVLVSNLNSREYPTTNAEKKGKVNLGDEWPVYLMQEAEGYTWYMIEPNRWIADDGSWLEYQK